MTVRVVDRGAAALLKAAEDARESFRVKVGIVGDDTNKTPYEENGDITVAEVAEQHEFGIGVPQRSWLRAFVDQNEGRIKGDLRGLAETVLRRHLPVGRGLAQLGTKIVAGIQQRMANRIPPPLHPYTLMMRKHGGTVPLIDTGQLRSSITYLVEPGGPEGTS